MYIITIIVFVFKLNYLHVLVIIASDLVILYILTIIIFDFVLKYLKHYLPL